MRITTVNIPESEGEKRGFQPIKMGKLGKTVIVAGKNGAGKTRFLDYLMGLTAQSSQQPPRPVSILLAKIKEAKESLPHYDSNRKKTEQANIAKWQAELDESPYVEMEGLWKPDTARGVTHNNGIIRFVPKKLELAKAGALAKHDIKNRAGSSGGDRERVGVHMLDSATLPKIQYLQDQWRDATHQQAMTPLEEREKIIEEYERLSKLIEEILGTKLGRDVDGSATLFGRPIDNAHLSDGQTVLLQLAIAIHTQADSVKDLILVLDEPENHLHPAIVLDFLDRLSDIIGTGQIIISTHSVHVISHFGIDNVWFMERGGISRAGKSMQRVLEGLIGDEKRIGKMVELLDSPARMALVQFAYESLIPPAVVASAGFGDPQVDQVMDAVGNQASPIRILDFGCGKGRLIATIGATMASKGERVEKVLDYIGYDPSDENRSFCESVISEIYGSAEGRHFSELTAMLDKGLNDHFDFILLCNVFHEIDPVKWTDLFGASSAIYRLLKPSGFLLIVEDEQIPHGEKAFTNGFHILGADEVRALFKLQPATGEYTHASQRNGRLSCHKIARECIARVSAESRIACLRRLRDKAMEKIRNLREKTPKYELGRIHGLWIMQFANASLSLTQLGDIDNPV